MYVKTPIVKIEIISKLKLTIAVEKKTWMTLFIIAMGNQTNSQYYALI